MTNTDRVAVHRITKREARTRWATGTQLVGFSNNTIDTVDSYGSLHAGDPLNPFDEVVATCTGSRRGERTVYFYAPADVVEPAAVAEVEPAAELASYPVTKCAVCGCAATGVVTYGEPVTGWNGTCDEHRAALAPTASDSPDAMDQGEHIDVGEDLDPLAVVCDCGVTVTGATPAETVAAWELHCEGGPAGRVPGEIESADGMNSYRVIMPDGATGTMDMNRPAADSMRAQGAQLQVIAHQFHVIGDDGVCVKCPPAAVVAPAADWPDVAAGRVPGETAGVRSVTYCKGHGWQSLLGTLKAGEPEACPNCTVRVSAPVPVVAAGRGRVPGETESACGEVRPGMLGYQLCRLIDEHAGDHRSQDRGAWARA